ncbi:uncharacterized protein LOC109868737 isoform X1 [Oncorhynchus kisutch]|uniref:uncharacterized protein LOC109868737 isoform X1 n=1 Tax=Oncorhynchus kisutch TaxID=8019 RepID=UPI0012DDE9B7|nr:uncharacterized protein LOC109868737 isoform X1 [Oncorhynchus kisutch]XP_031659185.1 uncharacterized protein LOC109868737 isoform X1 [Oncorhynchus kisutch]XP_031659186.1 uncharacterized protein LOC109868737 isoform X1 [Oncorhynchus kisutch]XP_031659187.1 uncharacterized protein LOC109868737 isoform X1 [Oncorhynchus kisutch]
MYFSFILLIYATGVAVKESCADLVPTPTIVFSPGYINVATPVTIRCESPNGTECKFYKDHDPNPIRKLDYKQGACQFKLFWNEFKRWNKTEVDLSCVILQNREGETIKTSKPSDAQRLNVGDPIGKPSVHVFKIGKYLNLRCEAKAGTSCYFYLNIGDSHFKKLPYKDNVCLGRVAEEELLRKKSSAGEIFITCAVELVVEGEDTVTSQHSEPLGITIDGATSSPSTFSLITTVQEKTSSNVTDQGRGTKFHVVISLGTCSLFLVLLAGCVLGVLQRKCGVQGRPVNTGSPPEQQDQTPPCVYSVITKPSRDEEEDTSLQYATVTYTGDQASCQYATVTSTGNQVEPGRTKIKFEIAGEYALLAES